MARTLVLLLLLPLWSLAVWWRRRTAPPPRDIAADAAMEAGRVPVARVVRAVLCRLETRSARQFVRLEAAVAETLTIGGDRQALEELLAVLCAYAIESTPCGRVLVTAGHRGGGTTIAIVDDGIGVATARTARVLELSREALALLGGTLDVRRRQGVGTTMTILLPAPASAPPGPWNATIQSTMADFARVTESHTDRNDKHAEQHSTSG